MKRKKLLVFLLSTAFSISAMVGASHTAYADINTNTGNYYAGQTGGYIAGNLDNNTPIYEPEYVTYADSLIPAKYPDNMDEFKVKYPALRDQGSYGACWAFSSIGLAEFDLINDKTKDSKVDLSELQLAYFTYNSVLDPLGGTEGDYTKYHSENTNTSYLNAGGNYQWAMKRFSQWVGTVNENDVPYDNALDSISYGLDDKYAYGYDVAHLQNAFEIDIKSQTQDVKQQIIEHGAVGVSYTHKNAGVNYINKSYYDTSDTVIGYGDGGHAVMVVGWDDNYSKDNFTSTNSAGETVKPSNNGAWLVRNSWGESTSYYNQLDYFWMSYETYSLNSTAWAFDFSADDGFDNNYQIDGGLENQVDYYYDNVANVFTVGSKEGVESETLKSVSLLFSQTANVGYTIDIYTDMTDSLNPLSGTRTSGANGVTSYAGYYTIPLDNEVELKPGSTFAVVVKTDKKAIEYEYTWSTQQDINSSNSSVIWEREVSKNFDGNQRSLYYSYGKFGVSPWNNYCIKAFTSDNYYKSDAEEVEIAKTVIENALKDVEADNELTDTDIQRIIDEALSKAGILEIKTKVTDFKKAEATIEKAGSIDASIAVTYGSVADTVVYSTVIKQLPKPAPEPVKRNGLCKADDGNYYYYVNDVIDTSFTDIIPFEDEWVYVENGKVNFNYSDLFNSPTCGWWKITDGKVDFGYSDLYYSPTYGWWKVAGGAVDFSYNDLYNSSTCGWWKIIGGKVDFDYSDLYNSSTCGWWKIIGGKVDFDYSDLYNSSTCGWWKIIGGKVDFDYSDLYNSSTCGWWKIIGGKVDFDYSDLYNSSTCGWWKIAGGAVDFGYNGWYNSSRYGWWNINGGAVMF
jgi:C1A family cysteine protease/ribosomal protein L15